MQPHPPFLSAGNAGPFTLDGTRSYRVGTSEVAIVDPGPDVESHVRALVASASDADVVRVVVTHRHADHAAAAPALAAALKAEIWGPAEVDGVARVLEDGDVVPTDAGPLVAVHTPGHTAGHLCFHWPDRRALFAGDLVLGRGDTTWVAEYPGCVTDYLRSLERLRTLSLGVIYPAHGPPLEDVTGALDRFRDHRAERIRQVRDALAEHPDASIEELLSVVYRRTIPSGVGGCGGPKPLRPRGPCQRTRHGLTKRLGPCWKIAGAARGCRRSRLRGILDWSAASRATGTTCEDRARATLP